MNDATFVSAGSRIVPAVQSLLDDPSTPFWGQDVLRVALTKDPVDAAHFFQAARDAFDLAQVAEVTDDVCCMAKGCHACIEEDPCSWCVGRGECGSKTFGCYDCRYIAGSLDSPRGYFSWTNRLPLNAEGAKAHRGHRHDVIRLRVPECLRPVAR